MQFKNIGMGLLSRLVSVWKQKDCRKENQEDAVAKYLIVGLAYRSFVFSRRKAVQVLLFPERAE